MYSIVVLYAKAINFEAVLCDIYTCRFITDEVLMIDDMETVKILY